MNPASPRSFAVLSIGAALLTMALKALAYGVTGSIGLLSDALESGINLVAAGVAVWALSLAAKPADIEHPYGHSKAEYFSSGVEGSLIVVASISIALAAWERLWDPQPLQQLGWGLGLSLVATLINGTVAGILLRAGRRFNSIALRADAQHLLSDVWTSVGVGVAIILIGLTGWLILDPLIAFGVAGSILWTGINLLRETGDGILDQALPEEDQARILRVLQQITQTLPVGEVSFHAILTRRSGSRRFVSLQMRVPGSWTVQQGHHLCDRVEEALRAALSNSDIVIHMEPLGVAPTSTPATDYSPEMPR
ncbi:MAG: cation transporter [Synechococcaceae cyanobacterium SM2_3_2]|nr:cation transporter [Synechococcaceae cyanobacterium SM2_3_2]